jgi:hypothetical protein
LAGELRKFSTICQRGMPGFEHDYRCAGQRHLMRDQTARHA